MGRLIFPGHIAEFRYVIPALKVYYDNGGWVSTDDYIKQEFSILKSNGVETKMKKDRTDYTKDAEIPRYFGFVERKRPGDIRSDCRITASGKQFYKALVEKDEDSVFDALMYSFENVTFGRNNEGCPNSDSDIEAPNILLISSLMLEGVSRQEYAAILYEMLYNKATIISALTKIRILSRTSSAIVNTVRVDNKLIPFLINCNFLIDSGGKLYLNKKVLEKYQERISKLPVLNTESIFFPKDEQEMQKIKENLNVIYYGVPGTGKTFKMQKLCEAYTDYVSVTFHQSFSYEEFVEGIRPKINQKTQSNDVEYEYNEGVFLDVCEKAAQKAGFKSLKASIEDSYKNRKSAFHKPNIDVLLCIDEINRANVSSVFGELISLIEPSKRLGADNEMIVKLPYSGKSFGVPANLKIIGTMNTADRSVQLLDSALRRRFCFIECQPSPNDLQYENAAKLLESINNRIRCVADNDHQIGHAYFWNVKDDYDLFVAMRDKVIPLLQEYFYDDTYKIRFVLNEIQPNNDFFYVVDDSATKAFKTYNIDGEERQFYRLRGGLTEVQRDTFNPDFINHII